MKFRD
jgi:hypothetical protein